VLRPVVVEAVAERTKAQRCEDDGIAIGVRAVVRVFELGHAQAQAQELVFAGAAFLGLDAALHAHAHRLGLASDFELALPGRDRIFAIHLPGALSHGRGRRPIGEHASPVGAALQVDLGRRRGVGERGAGSSADKGDDDQGRAQVQRHDLSRERGASHAPDCATLRRPAHRFH
jgi:hypothetical protein